MSEVLRTRRNLPGGQAGTEKSRRRLIMPAEYVKAFSTTPGTEQIIRISCRPHSYSQKSLKRCSRIQKEIKILLLLEKKKFILEDLFVPSFSEANSSAAAK